MGPIEVYKAARKKHDQIWNVFVARPLAAPIVALLMPTRVTPNQLTFLNLAIFVVATVVMALVPDRRGSVLGVLILEASYVFDCADGMLARTKRLASPTGHLLDFLTDELKAFCLVGGIAVHLWLSGGLGWDGGSWPAGDPRFLVAGIVGLVIVASGLSLTTFVRRPEYSGKATTTEAHYETATTEPAKRSPARWVAHQVLTFLRFLNHYPSHIWVFGLLDRLDVFLGMYLVLNTLYVGRTSLGILARLGRPLPRGNR